MLERKYTQKSLSGIEYSDKKAGGSKHTSNFLRSIRSWKGKLSI